MSRKSTRQESSKSKNKWRLPRWNLLTALVVILLTINVSCGSLIWTQWRVYNEELFGANAKYSTNKIYRHSYSTDTYDFLLSLQRLESKCSLYASHRIDKTEFNIQRREIVGHYTNFIEDTDMGRTLRSYPQFAITNRWVSKFLTAANELENNQIDPARLFEVATEAIDTWALLRQDVYTSEYETRQRLEEGSRIAFQSVQRSLVWLLILFVILIVSSSTILYLVYRILLSDKRSYSTELIRRSENAITV